MINSLMTRLGPGIDQHANLRLQHPPNGIEQPPMTINLLGVILFQNEYDLNGDQIVRITGMRLNQLRFGVYGNLSGVFENVSDRPLLPHLFLDHGVLVYSDGGE
jgi:hypothetical protein